MDPERYSQAKRLFLESLERPPEARERFVAARAGGDAALAGEVLGLLRAHGPAGDVLDEGAVEALAMSPPLELPAAIGPYRILAMLGRGGMGAVYRARRDDQPEIALKVMDAGLLSSRLNSRFQREASTLARLRHRGIARFLETGTYDTPLGPQPYVAMELVSGQALRVRAADPSWGDRDRVAFAAEVAEALAHAHACGVIHRDLKPDNLMVADDGHAVVLDFGIARVTGGEPGAPLTLTGDVIGTVQYMSPEQAQGISDEIDGRSDLYSLGVVTYELLSGTMPYALETRSLTRALVQVATMPARPLGLSHPRLKGGLEAILEKTLMKHPMDRYAGAAALAADLRRWLDGRPIEAQRGRRRRRLRTLARSRGGAVTAVAASLAAVLGFGLLSIPGVRHRLPPLAEVDRAAMLARIDQADLLVHTLRPSHDGLRQAVALYETARRALTSYPRDTLCGDLERYLTMRLGETHFMIGAADHDVDELQRADEAFNAMNVITRPRGYRPSLDPRFPVTGRMAVMTPEQGYSGSGLARMELARYRDPAFNVRRALGQRQAAIDSFVVTAGLRDFPARLPRGDLALAAARLLNESAESTVALGDLTDTMPLVDEGIAQLRIARSIRELRDTDRVAYASILENLGEAFLARARRGDRPALDSARVQLREALAIRIDWRRRARVDTRLALADCELVAERGAPLVGGLVHLTAASNLVTEANADLVADTASSAARVPMWIMRARVMLGIRERGGEPYHLGPVTELLDSARTALAGRGEARLVAMLSLLDARAIRVAADPDSGMGLQTAARELQRAAMILPADQDQPFARMVAGERAALDSVIDRTPSIVRLGPTGEVAKPVRRR